MLVLQPRVRRLLAATVAVTTTMALSAGVANAKGTSGPKKLNQSTAKNVDAIVEQTLGAGWMPPPNSSANDGRARKYLTRGRGYLAPFVHQHAKMLLTLARENPGDVPHGGTLTVNVEIASFPSASNAARAAMSWNRSFYGKFTTVGSFQTAAGSVPYYNVNEQGTFSNGQPATFTGCQTDEIPLNNFVVNVNAFRDQLSTRTDAMPVMQAITNAIATYLKTGAQ